MRLVGFAPKRACIAWYANHCLTATMDGTPRLRRCLSRLKSTMTLILILTLPICVLTPIAQAGQGVSTLTRPTLRCELPTFQGTVSACQNERSQHANKDTAMKMLRAKLYELEMQKRMETQQALEDSKSDIGWGSQIRSYVLDDSRIKDLRTGVETSNTGAVLDGDLDQFIEASLKAGV